MTHFIHCVLIDKCILLAFWSYKIDPDVLHTPYSSRFNAASCRHNEKHRARRTATLTSDGSIHEENRKDAAYRLREEGNHQLELQRHSEVLLAAQIVVSVVHSGAAAKGKVQAFA